MLASPNVVVVPQEPDHPVLRHKNKLIGIGITEILIGIATAGVGFYYVVALSSPVSTVEILSGIWFILSGSLAIAAGNGPSECTVQSGIGVAVIASIAAGVVLIRGGVGLGALVFFCNVDYEYETGCQAKMGLIVCLGVLVFLGFVEFILAIVHASYSCLCCCGGHSAPIRNAGMTMTQAVAVQPAITPGHGYAAFTNPPDEKMAYAAYPPQANAYPPAYN